MKTKFLIQFDLEIKDTAVIIFFVSLLSIFTYSYYLIFGAAMIANDLADLQICWRSVNAGPKRHPVLSSFTAQGHVPKPSHYLLTQ